MLARSKFNSIDTLVSHTLINSEIVHEDIYYIYLQHLLMKKRIYGIYGNKRCL